MTRRSFLAAIPILLAVRVACAQTWVDFHSQEPAKPVITLLESDANHITYRISIPGMWVTEIAKGEKTYKKLEIPGFTTDDQLGVPALPRATTQIAVPRSASLTVTTNHGRTLQFTQYLISPVPQVNVTNNVNALPLITEIYEEDPNIYSSSTYYPNENAVERNHAFFVTQEVGRLDVYPIRFNPATSTLEVFDTLIVNVSFEGGSGPVNQDLGLFNAVAHNTIINYDIPIPSHLSGFGSVRWLDAQEPASSIVCDYLIVIPDQDWTHQAGNEGFDNQVQRFAELRASLSGLDVCIVRASHYLPGQAPEGCIERGPVDNIGGQLAYEGIRNYVKQVFDEGHSRHSPTGKLTFLLLIGNPRPTTPTRDFGVDDWILPSPRVPSNYDFQGGDGYYGRLTQVNGTFDDLEDIGVGRFPVRDAGALENMVDKIIAYSVSPGDRSWKNNVLNMYGWDISPQGERVAVNYFSEAAEREHEHGYFVNYATRFPDTSPQPYNDNFWSFTEDEQDQDWITNILHNGVSLLGINSHGWYNWAIGWSEYRRIYDRDWIIGLNSPDKLHLIVSFSCYNAWSVPQKLDSFECHVRT
jgi:hypothetical protein